jgi:hypothetical protein
MKRALLAAIALASLSHAAGAQPVDDAIAQMKSCLKSDGPTRQQCIDKLWWELTGDSAPVPSTRSGGSWIVSETTSPVDYSPQISAANPSRATAEGAPSSLTIHCRRQRVELSVSTIGAWKASSSDEFRVAYRIDDQPIVEARWAASAGGRTASFKGDALALLQSLPDGGQISIRVFDWQGPPHEATFQLDGLDVVRQKIVEACKSEPAADRALARKRR